MTLRPLSVPLVLLLAGCPQPGDSDTGGGKTPVDTVDSYAPITDVDGDGWSPTDGDCDDTNADVHPTATELCNTIDDNCDGRTDEGYFDVNGDGAVDCEGTEACDGVDNDQDGLVDEDSPDTDGDGTADCMDTEACDGLDNDGNGTIDDVGDADGDGVTACSDCDDTDATVFPGAGDPVDGVDNNCNGLVDDSTYAGTLRITEVMFNPQFLADPEGEWIEVQNLGDAPLDLRGLTIVAGSASEALASGLPLTVEAGGYAVLGGDLSPEDNGGITELWQWNDLDLPNDVGSIAIYAGDTLVTEASWNGDDVTLGASWMLDRSSIEGGPDQWCSSSTVISDFNDDLASPGAENEYCVDLDHDGDGYSTAAGDCDDGDATFYPGAPDAWYDGVDNDCAADDDYDADKDGSDLDVDCDDGDATAHPGAAEVCDDAGVDEDCNGLVDDDDPGVTGAPTWSADADGDGYGSTSGGVTACTAPADTVSTGGDCDDTTTLANPGQTETCGDGIDNDCDGTANDCTWTGEVALDTDGYDGKYVGVRANDAAGCALAEAGDVDGDGAIDLLVGASGADDGARDGGAVYIVPGKKTGTQDLVSLGGEITGTRSSDTFGAAVAGGGNDLDGDGVIDFVVGATGADGGGSASGGVYILPASLSTVDDSESAATVILDGGAASDAFGAIVASPGDVDADGYDDLYVAAAGADDGGSNTGSVYLFRGPLTSDGSADDADVMWEGASASEGVGNGMAAGSDVTGDGLPDVLMGAPGAGTKSTGHAYLGSGSDSGVVSVSSAVATFDGEGKGDAFGDTVALPGDLDGDGYDDVLIAAYKANGGGTTRGRIYIQPGPVSGTYSMSSAYAYIEGVSDNTMIGTALAPLGDMDGDGADDFAIGADNTTNGGLVFLMYGDAYAGAYLVSDAGATFLGTNTDQFVGSSIVGGSDYSRHYAHDLVIGASGDATAASGAGAIFVLQGGRGL